MQGSEKNSGKTNPLSESDDEADVWTRVAKSTRKLKQSKGSYQAERPASQRVRTPKNPQSGK